MIQGGLFTNPGPPPFVARERAVLPCGCFVAVGLRMDLMEGSVACAPCGQPHVALMERFSLALTDSLVNPSKRLLIDVVDEFLTAAAAEM